MLEHIQGQLEEIYHLDKGPNVRDFLITEQTAAAMGLSRRPAEQLILRRHPVAPVDPVDPVGDGEMDKTARSAPAPNTGEEDELEVGLFMDERLLAHLDAYDPRRGIGPQNLHEWCVVVEGVSHFLLVNDRASANRKISALELELQAEVDKYVTTYLSGGSASPAAGEGDLRSRIFDGIRLAEDLSVEEAERYQKATQTARRYAGLLGRRFIRKARVSAMMEELRRFYRADLGGKLARIASLA